MVEITLELTRRCNYDCGHCLRDFSGDLSDLPLELIQSVLEQAQRYGLTSVGITGGEPTLHPQLGEIFELIASRGLAYHFVTNGTTFIKRVLPLLEGARREQLTFVCFSLDGATAQTHDRIRGPKSFATVMRAISACKMNGIDFGLSFPLGKHNRDEIDQAGLLASHLGADFLTFDHVHPTADNVELDIALPLSEWREVERDVHRLMKTLTLRVTPCYSMHHPDPLHMCPTMAGTTLHVDWQGNLIFCCTLSGYRGPKERTEIVADLREVSLFEAHRRFLERVHQLNRKKLERVERGVLSQIDHHPCMACHKHFGQLDWTKDYDGDAVRR